MENSMKKILVVLMILTGLAGALVLFYWQNIERMRYVSSLFTGAEQYEMFNRVKDMFPVTELKPSTKPYQFPHGETVSLPESFIYEGETLDVPTFLVDTDTAAMLVLHEGRIVFEEYYLTGGRDVQWLSMSVAKSFVSIAIGIAIDEGLIASVEEAVTDYLPSLKGSAYDGVRIKDILQMSSGAAWNEDYSDPDSEVMRMGKIMALGGSLDEFITTLKPEREPGTYNQYNSADTQVLGALLVAATGKTITDYMQEKIWQPLGMQDTAYWIVDDHGMEMAFAGLNLTARDYAKVGELFRNQGNWQGKQLVSADWVKASVTPDAPHLLPGDNPLSDFDLGYGYQWWVLDGDQGEYMALGVYNQFIYVNPTKGLVIVKLSANSDYGTVADSEEVNKEFTTIELLRAIGEVVVPSASAASQADSQ
jgi:CubicO group peptidase (beta-lactamase class C family)